jgi:DNA-binding XRE family transcriptional regulator
VIKNRLKEIRLREYMMESQEFARLLEINHTTYSNWELGVSRPTLEKAFLVADKLNKRVDDIWHLEK